MQANRILEYTALAACCAILAGAAWFWSGQINDVLEFLALVAEVDG